jgi:monovalent cation/proton antiporter MnhG/PhaG subunit
MSTLIDAVLALLVVAGALLLFAAGLGLLRGADPITRLQSVAKAGSVGAMLLLFGIAIAAGDFAVFMRAMATGVLILINTALMAQILAESADRDHGKKTPPRSQ